MNKFFHRLIFFGANQKYQKYCSRASEHLFKRKKLLFFWKKSTKSKTPGLSFSSKKTGLCFSQTLSQKKFEPELRLRSKKFKVQKRLSSIHKVSQSEQVILFDALSPDQLLK
jgi:hypothetical protein